jgi:sulfur carrier protein
MHIVINGQLFDSPETRLDRLLENWGAQTPFAVALNKHFVPKQQLAKTNVSAGDIIDIVTPVSGG